MEQSEQQKEILELGELLVKELGLEKSVDTLSRWMAHYVAEKITGTKNMPDGVKKKNAQKECFSLVLDLWEHRWNYKPDRRPLRDFDQLFAILESINPDKEETYYFRYISDHLQKEYLNTFDPSDIRDLSAMAVQVDMVARIWIEYLLREAAGKASNEDIKKIINNAANLPGSADARIVQFFISTPKNEDEITPQDEKDWYRSDKISTLKHRIEELRKFKDVNEYLIVQYEKELDYLSGDSVKNCP